MFPDLCVRGSRWRAAFRASDNTSGTYQKMQNNGSQIDHSQLSDERRFPSSDLCLVGQAWSLLVSAVWTGAFIQ
jgi:hypothetical protein